MESRRSFELPFPTLWSRTPDVVPWMRYPARAIAPNPIERPGVSRSAGAEPSPARIAKALVVAALTRWLISRVPSVRRVRDRSAHTRKDAGFPVAPLRTNVARPAKAFVPSLRSTLTAPVPLDGAAR